MKKKVFSLMMALVLGLFGLAQAQVSLPYTEGFENGIGNWTVSFNSSLVSGSYGVHSGSYAFCFHWTTNPPQYLISPELTGADNGVEVSFYYYNESTYYTETFQVGYSTTTNAVSAFTFVGSEITAPHEWTEYTETFPAGTKYVAIKNTSYDAYYMCVDDFTFTAVGGGQGGDDPDQPEYEAGLHTLATYGVGDNAEELIDVLAIERPNGAWMEPYHFNLYNDGDASVEVMVIDFLHNNGYFTLESEVPFTLANNGRPGVDLYLNTNRDWSETEMIESLLAVNTDERSTHLFEIVAAPYTPYCPDVVEKAYDLGDLTQGLVEWREYMSELWDGSDNEFVLHNNYDMPDFEENIPDGYDAVMKFTVDRAMSLNARVAEDYENGKVALYAANFGGEEGPMANNYYTERPMNGGGSTPSGAGFEAFIGDVNSTSTSNYFPFHTLWNYSLAENLFLASELRGAGVTTAPMTSLSWDVSSFSTSQDQTDVKIWMANVSDAALTSTSHTTAGMTLVYSGAYPVPTVGWNEFVFNQGTFAWDGHSNVLIVCQRNRGSWDGSISWRCTNPGFVAQSYDYTDGSAYNATSQTYSMYTTNTLRANIKFKSNGGRENRDAYTYGFENGLDGWTALDVNLDGGTWVHSNNNPAGYIDPSEEPYYPALAHTGTGFAMCYSFVDYDGAYDTDSYLISPQQYTLDNNSSITFWADNANDNYPESFSVCVSTAANPTASSFTQVWGGEAKAGSNDHATVRATNNRYENWRSHTVNLGAYAGQTVWIAFHDVNYDAYEIWIDDVTVNAASGTTPVDPVDPVDPINPNIPETFAEFSAGPIIENLNVLPGTYYLVASSTDRDYEVEINVKDLPCAAPAVAVYPVDNAYDIEPTGVVLRWQLDPNCTEYRLVFSSTYWPEDNDHHPSTIITDWTNQLATSYALPPLWNNTNYFWRIEQRVNGGEENGGCTTVGHVFGFTTTLNIPHNLQANPTELFEGETTTLSWTAIQDRTYRHYNIYKDGELIHSTADTPDPTSNCTWVVPATELEYNMDGYVFYVTALYDEGESAPSNTVEVKVSGYSATNGINGYVYEYDGTTPIPGVTVTVTGTDEFGDSHTYEATTNADGYYEMQVYVGTYTTAIATCPGYQDATPYENGPTFSVAHEAHHDNMNFKMDEEFNMPGMVCAEPVYVPGVDGDTLIHIYWTSPFSASSSPFEAQIGEGTSTTGYFPFYTLYNYSIATALYTAEELTAASVTSAPMTSLSWYATNSIDEAQNGITIWMANVDNTTAPATSPLASGMTKVYTGSVPAYAPTGWMEFTFNEESFSWDGQSNVMILVQRNNGSWTSSIQWRYTAAGFNATSYAYTDNAPYNAETTGYTLNTSANRPNIIMKGGNRGTAELSRSLHHYNIYRTSCYNNGPYTDEEGPHFTEFLATVWVPDTSYFDVSWPDVEPGVYKWGVSAVYQGNRTVDYPWEERESEIMWHTDCAPCIDKDMQTEVTVNVVLNSADSPEGTVVSFTNLNEGEQMNHPQPSITLDGTGYYEFPTFRKGDYLVTVYLPGYELIEVEESIWEPRDLRYVLTEIIYGVKNLYVSRTGWAMWDAETWEDYPIPSGGGTTSSIIDFETGNINQFAFDNTIGTYHWSVVQEGNGGGYCMKSGNGGVGGSTSTIEASVNYTSAGTISFDLWSRGEGSSDTYDWDKSRFYIDGVRMFDYGAHSAWETYTHDVAAGQHTFRWEYKKDGSVNPAGDCFLVDNINFNIGGRSESAERHLEGFKVMCTSLDDAPIFNYNTPFYRPFCQLTTVDPWSGQPTLIEGERYKVKVAAIYSTGQSDWCEPVIWQYEPCDHWGPVDEVTYNATTAGNHIEWVFEHGHNQWVGPVNPDDPQGEMTVLLHEDFNGLADDAIQPGWTVAGGDDIYGETWFGITSASFGIPFPSGSNAAMMSASYWNGSCTPDNWLFTPEFTDARKITYTYAVNTAYPGDHYAVLASTTGNNIADFSVVFEETPTGRDNGENGKFAPGRSDRWEASWVTREVELPAGTKYIAFHHYDCYDMNFLLIDEVTVEGYNGGAKGGNSIAAYNSEPVYSQYANDGLKLNFFGIHSVYFRAYLLYALTNDSRFELVPDTDYGQFLVTPAGNEANFLDEFENFYASAEAEFAQMSKVDVANNMPMWKSSVSSTYSLSIMMDVIANSTRVDNDHCINSLPFCTTEAITFPAASGMPGASENADYGCMTTSPNPAWYHMRIHTGGSFVIHMEADNVYGDIDFVIWGPFTDPTEPCFDQLTTDKIIDCSYSPAAIEDCFLGYHIEDHDHGGSSLADGDINYHVPEAGEYYILLITNYDNAPCNISFTKTEGEGETDCDIVTPSDIIGFLITQDGEYDTIVGPDVREYTDFGEFGEHEYCVRPIYPGPAILPDTNYYFSMGCPVCVSTDGSDPQPVCDPGNPIYAEVNGTDDQVHIWWSLPEPTPDPSSFSVNFDGGMPEGWTTIDADGDGYGWILGSACDGIYLNGGNLSGSGHNASADLIVSGSYSNMVGELLPDNYLVSPELILGGTFSFYACAQDAGYAAEHFGVAVSLDGTNFTMVNEWTLTAKNAPAKAERDDRAQGNWYSFSVDLSDYEGMTGYVAIRHFNCTDQFLLDVDDIEMNARGNRDGITGYNIYRSADGITYELIGTVAGDVEEYFDAPGAGTYYYQVTAVYEGCESEPAVSGENPEENFVMVGVTGVGEDNDNVNLFPNPTKGNVTIQAKDMNRITVVSVLGQVVFDTELDQDEYILNMAQFTNGMYMVRIYTDGGVTVKRVTVMH